MLFQLIKGYRLTYVNRQSPSNRYDSAPSGAK